MAGRGRRETALGAETTVIGTLVGAFFGVQVGSAGKEKAEEERSKSENLARLAWPSFLEIKPTNS
jgi:hypothetical protein